MKSLATTLLICLTCIGIAGTMALIDRSDATLAATSTFRTHSANETSLDAGSDATLAEFARSVQARFSLAQPSQPVVFDDLRPSDPNYAPAQAVYPFLHRQLLCPDCALTSNFSPNSSLTRAQSAMVLVSILTEQRRISLLTPEQATEVLAAIPDAGSLSAFARPYIATAIKNGILTLRPGGMISPTQPHLRTDVTTAFNTIDSRFAPLPARASLHPATDDFANGRRHL
jgi:hypothetical protein